uniref:Uncharacterized protein n=1 Tax=Arundo donax TaxID=35708 RepID=A0A0A9ECP1_ARUDO
MGGKRRSRLLRRAARARVTSKLRAARAHAASKLPAARVGW